ncbi:uncharacterized protein [Vicugna pacos]|uniref:Uncharacterized protein isoform X2 n=1 Tax=Vicugna pacos TaxID=30538 RepID=A0ABM5DSI2_VICPA
MVYIHCLSRCESFLLRFKFRERESNCPDCPAERGGVQGTVIDTSEGIDQFCKEKSERRYLKNVGSILGRQNLSLQVTSHWQLLFWREVNVLWNFNNGCLETKQRSPLQMRNTRPVLGEITGTFQDLSSKEGQCHIVSHGDKKCLDLRGSSDTCIFRSPFGRVDGGIQTRGSGSGTWEARIPPTGSCHLSRSSPKTLSDENKREKK